MKPKFQDNIQQATCMDICELNGLFKAEFGVEPEIFRAPGRVNLIGEHTDYNDGFVLPSAIGFYAHVAIAPRSDRRFVFRSTSFKEKYEVDFSVNGVRKLNAWCDYVLGVGLEILRLGVDIPGANIWVNSQIPIGSGLSSSAALEVASAIAFLSLAGRELQHKEIARLCQRAENNFVGARVGIMDQFVSCHGKQGCAVLLDCRSLESELVSIPPSVQFVICNTMARHELSGGEYNLRREQCEEGVRILAKTHPGVRALRDATIEQLKSKKSEFPEIIYKRCTHVIEEDERVMDAVKAFRSGNLSAVGALMAQSHASLRDLYEVSCFELDAMVESAQGLTGFIGGRMTGGGFGGCTVNLVESAHAESFAASIAERYQHKTGIKPEIYICSAADGAGVEGRRSDT